MDSERSVKRVLAPHHEMIRGIIDAAFEKWNSLPEWAKSEINRFSRTRANVLWAFIVAEASRVFMDVGEIEENDEDEQQQIQTVTYTLRVGDKVLVFRFKKMSITGETCNVLTARQLSFISSLEMPGVPDDAIRVSIGYVENSSASGALHVLVKHEDRAEEWTYEIPAASAQIIHLPERAAEKEAKRKASGKGQVQARNEDETEDETKEDVGSISKEDTLGTD